MVNFQEKAVGIKVGADAMEVFNAVTQTQGCALLFRQAPAAAQAPTPGM